MPDIRVSLKYISARGSLVAPAGTRSEHLLKHSGKRLFSRGRRKKVILSSWEGGLIKAKPFEGGSVCITWSHELVLEPITRRQKKARGYFYGRIVSYLSDSTGLSTCLILTRFFMKLFLDINKTSAGLTQFLQKKRRGRLMISSTVLL